VDELAPHQEDASLAFERTKWEAAQKHLDREYALKERELLLRETEARRARLFGAAVGSVLVSLENKFYKSVPSAILMPARKRISRSREAANP
jgi:hypothetical protein